MPRNEDYNDKFMNLCDWNFSDANTINLCNLGDNNTQNDGLENLQSRQNYIELDPAKDPKKEPNKDSDKKTIARYIKEVKKLNGMWLNDLCAGDYLLIIYYDSVPEVM